MTLGHKRRKQANRGAWRATVLTSTSAVNRAIARKGGICRAWKKMRRNDDSLQKNRRLKTACFSKVCRGNS